MDNVHVLVFWGPGKFELKKGTGGTMYGQCHLFIVLFTGALQTLVPPGVCNFQNFHLGVILTIFAIPTAADCF